MPLRADFAALPGNVRGAVHMVAAGLAFSVMGTLVKLVGAELDSFQLVFFRCAFGFVLLLPFMARAGRGVWRTGRFHMHVLRAVFGLTAMSCMFYGIAHLPLATAIALTFSKPLFMIVLAVLFLGEAVRWRRWAATAVGFGGVLLMMRPGSATFDPAALVALGGAVFVAAAMVTIKKMAATERTLSILCWFTVLATLISLPPALAVWRPPEPHHWLLLVGMGAAGTVGQSFLIRSYAAGEATAVAPFDYSRLLFAAAIGLALFDEVPDAWTIAGAVIVVLSTLYIGRREAKRRGAPGAATAAPVGRGPG